MFICDQLPNSKMRISPRPQHQTVAVAVASKLAVSRASQGSPVQAAQPSPVCRLFNLWSPEWWQHPGPGIPRGRGPEDLVNLDTTLTLILDRYYPNRY